MASLDSLLAKLKTEAESDPNSVIAQILNSDDVELGMAVNPNAKDEVGGIQKVLRGLWDSRNLSGFFDDDAAEEGRAFKGKLAQALLAGEAENQLLTERKKKQQIQEAQDFTGATPETAVKDLPRSTLQTVQRLGLLPTKEEEVDISSQVLGPTRPVFSNTPQRVSTGTLIPDHLGSAHTFEGAPPIPGMSPEIKRLIDTGAAGSGDLLDAVLNSPGSFDESGSFVEHLMRKMDPGLQATSTQISLDPEGTLSPAEILQVHQAIDTQTRTPVSQKEMVPAEVSRAGMRTLLQAAGVPEDRANTILSNVPDMAPTSMINNLASNLTNIASTVMREEAKNSRAQEFNDRQDMRVKMRGDIQASLQERGAALSLQNNMAIREIVFGHQRALQEGRIDSRKQLAEQQDARRLDGQLTLLRERQAFTKEDHELNRAASYAQQVLRGEQALDLEGVRQLNKLAIANAKVGEKQHDTVQKFYLDFMKGNPAVAGQLLDILSSAPEGIDPFSDQAIRGSLAKRVQAIVDSQVVTERIRATVDTDIYGNTLAEKMSSLHAAKVRFLKGDQERGIPPMSVDQVREIDEQIAAMEGFAKTGSSSTTIKLDMNEKSMNVTDAAKFAAMRQALKEMDTIEKLVFDEQGGIRRSVIATSSEVGIPGTDLKFGGIPFTQGRQLRQAMMNAGEARLRAESGAAVPESEVLRQVERFFPSNLDSDDGVRSKLKRFKDWVNEAISLVDPVGTQRSRAASSTPVESLKEPAKKKPFDARLKELKDRGLSEEAAFEQMAEEGY